MKNIENLVFKGGGVKGIAYAGAYKALEEKGLTENIKRVDGTSAGAIISFLIAIGCGSTEITYILNELKFKKLETGLNPLRLFTKYGLFSGDWFYNWLKERLKDNGLDENITFKDLNSLAKNNKKFKDLYVFAVSLNRENVVGFSVDRTPDVKIVDAVRGSMSIPGFFKAWTFKEMPNELFVDGGLIYNYPMSVFDNKEFLKGNESVNKRTLGFYLGNKGTGESKIKNDLNFNEPVKYIGKLFSTLIDGETLNFKRRQQDVARTIFLPDYGISATKFDISKDEIEKLYKGGYDNTLDNLKEE